MGYSSYSSVDREVRADSLGYTTNSLQDNFKSKSIQRAMDPKDLTVRESRDSEAHPNSVAIIIALDVTGSMMSVPQKIVADGLPHIMTDIIQGGTPDPQVLFLGVGDHECDSAPIQVSQFESGDEELDKWLTSIYMERGGGSNDGESYMLAYYTAAMHTSIDCFEKRGEKGLLFTIGDEKVLPHIPKESLQRHFGMGQYQDYTTKELITLAQEKYEIYHIHTMETGAGRRHGVVPAWKELLGQNVLVVQSHTEIPALISEIVSKRDVKPVGEESKDNNTMGVVTVIPKPEDKINML